MSATETAEKPSALAEMKTADLLAEMKLRIGEGEVGDFLAANAPDDDDDDWGEATLEWSETRDIVAELRDRAGSGDALAGDIAASLGDHAPLGLPAPPSDYPPALAEGVLTITAGSLAWALSAVCPVIERRNTIPIIGSMRLNAGAGLVEFTGTDLDIEVSASLALAGCGGPSLQLCFAPQALLPLVRRLDPHALMNISIHDGAVGIRWDRGHATLPMFPAEDFPPLSLDEYFIATWETEGLIEALDRVTPYISTEETRYYLNGVCFNKDGGAVTVCATDGHRLAALPIALPEEIASHRTILPRKSVELVRRLFRDRTFTVRVHGKEPNRMCFIAEGLRLCTKLIDGTFPAWDKVADAARTGGTERLVIDRRALLRAVETAVPFAPARTQSVRLAVEGDRLRLTVNNPDTGLLSIDAGPAEGDFIVNGGPVGINGGYLIAALRQAVRGERLTLRGCGPSNPIVIEDESGPGACFILMPLRV